jgi:hypothetical protein
VRGGGAPAQLARRSSLDLVDLARDGNTTHGVLTDMARAPAAADIVTLSAGGNDLLGGEPPREILRHGVASNEPWFVNVIEPNLAGATAIAEQWHQAAGRARRALTPARSAAGRPRRTRPGPGPRRVSTSPRTGAKRLRA